MHFRRNSDSKKNMRYENYYAINKMITSTVTLVCLGLAHYLAQRTIPGKLNIITKGPELISHVLAWLLFALYIFGPVSLLDGIIFYFKKRSFLSQKLGQFKTGLEVEGIENPESIRIKTNKEKLANFDGIYQKVEGEYCNGNPLWKISNGSSKWIFLSNISQWSVGTALIVQTSFTLDDSGIELEGEFSLSRLECDKYRMNLI